MNSFESTTDNQIRERNNFTWKIGGEAGYGIISSAQIFSKALARGGLNVFATSEYPSLIRGGHNSFEVKAREKNLDSTDRQVDLLVALDKETIEWHLDELSANAGIIYDPKVVDPENPKLKKKQASHKLKLFPIPFSKILEEIEAPEIVSNSVALGASVGVLEFELSMLMQVLEDTFRSKSDKILNLNLEAAVRGYIYAQEHYKGQLVRHATVIEAPKRRQILTGNEAISLGAIQAGCKFISAYPMTPSTDVLHFLAKHQQEFNIVVVQTEDEIAASTMAIGASFTGVRAMTSTSGGGFSLMVESLGLAAITETPMVYVLVQRPGPSTGLPTWTEQGDLQFVLNASHGDFPRVVVAPGDVRECFYQTYEAFNLAEKYQLPVIILSDKYLGISLSTTDPFDLSELKIERGKMVSNETLVSAKSYKRLALAKDGVSPRVLPGQPTTGIFRVTGNEHDEYGHISENAENRTRMVEKRQAKLDGLNEDIQSLKLHGEDQADLTIVSWGSTKGPILDAMEALERDGIKVNFIQLLYLSPFPTDKITILLFEAANTVLIENNFSGQLGRLIKEKTGIDLPNQILKYDGRPFDAPELYTKLREFV